MIHISSYFYTITVGEIKAIYDCPEGETTDVGWQNCSKLLSKSMLHAMTKNSNFHYYFGIPCHCEFDGIPFLITLYYLNITYNIKDLHITYKNNSYYSNDMHHHFISSQTSSYFYYNKPHIFFNFLKNISTLTCPTYQLQLTYNNNNNNNILQQITSATVFMNGNKAKAKLQLMYLFHYLHKKLKRNIHIITGAGHDVKQLPFPGAVYVILNILYMIFSNMHF